jgi:hypothetical protein
VPEGRKDVEDWLAGRGAVLVAILLGALVLVAILSVVL